MEFGLNEEQVLFDQALRGVLADRLPLDELREATASDDGFAEQLWNELVQLGLPGLLVPEEYGGSGLAPLDAAVAAEALAYHAAPVPYLAAVVMAPLAIRLLGDDTQQSAWLPRMASGEVRCAVGLCGLSGSTATHDIRVDGDLTSGEVSGVLDAGDATHVLLLLADGAAALFDAGAPGVTVTRRPSVDRTRSLATVTIETNALERLPSDGDKPEAASRVLDAGRVMLAADTLGAAQSMFDKALAYAGDRVQFDRPIAGFQAIKHMCADMISMLEPSRALVWYAAHAQDAIENERRLAACHAKAHLAEIGREIARMATEVHGGMGFTDLLGLHFWFKRISFNRQVLGGPERCRQEAAAIQGWSAA